MNSNLRLALALAAAAVMGTAVLAQFPSDVVGFNDAPIDDPAASREMFQIPEFSGTTRAYIELNAEGAYNSNSAFRAAGLQTEGDAALQVTFEWVDPLDPDAWVRLTTYNGINYPNPALHTQGKVRFNLRNRGDIFTFTGEFAIALGIRESGVVVKQLADGGISGPIEWVGVDPTVNGITAGADLIVNTTAAGDDVQEVPVGTDLNVAGLPSGTAVVSPGNNGVIDTVPAGDDALRRGYYIGAAGERVPLPVLSLPTDPDAYELEWNLVTGDVTVTHPFYYPSGQMFDGAVAGFTGNGVFDAPGGYGTFEHIAIANVTADPGTKIEFAIDELQFESPVPDPVDPPRIVAPVFATDTSVAIETLEDASQATLYVNDVEAGSAAPVSGVATVGGLSLTIGDVLTATQTANGLTSAPSAPVIVYAEGTALAEDFDLYADEADLTAVWTKTEPANDRQVELTSGSAASCSNYVMENVGAGGTASRLYFDLGGINGTDAEPLVVTYRFKHDVNSENARGRFELSPSLSRAFGAVGFAFTNDASVPPLLRQQYTTLTNSPEPIIDGYYSDYFFYDYAATGVARAPGVWHEMQIEVKSSVVNFYIDGALANPVDPDSGVELWPDGVPRVNNDSFRYLILGVGYSNNGVQQMYDNISVTFGGTPIPFGPPNPVESPALADQALLPGDVSVTVTDIDPAATAVAVYADGVQIASTTSPTSPETTLTVPALDDQAYVGATQTVGGVESCLSRGIRVAVPPPSVFPVLAPGQTRVQVQNIAEGVADAVAVYRDLGEGELVLLGSRANPMTDPVDVDVPALALGQFIVATQTVAGVESAPSVAVEVRDPGVMGPWIETSPLTYGTTGHRLVYLNGYVYCIGGRTNQSSASTQAVANVFYAAVQDDGSVGPWQATTQLPQPLASHGAAVYGDRIYVWGGWTIGGYPTVNTCYYTTPNPDGTITSWTTSSVTIPNSPTGVVQMDSFGNGVLAFGNHLYIINGELNDATNTSRCYVSTLTPGGDFGPWVQTSATPDPGSWFHGTGVVHGTTEDYFYRIAANYRGTYEVDTIKATINPDGTLGEWTQVQADLPDGRYELANAIVDNKWMFAVDGLSGATPMNTTYYAAINPDDGSISEWIEGLDYPMAISRNAAISYKASGRYYLLVVSGGPYLAAEQRDPRCFYAQIGVYFDLDSFADFQLCYDPTTVPSSDCQRKADLNNDGEIDADDLPELEEYFLGPDE